ncbi:GerAB/ArcD/ProY family transporter [Cohnella nanjingensis]|uniref:GerAB/ArcD/ProY family transporter n=1 Tax=Cohnella nanjingensis TaxID=1387779 RepID=A0A7X0RQ05_9BACL|nr:GerAB/ArcD/ProY family transporter [Cohnella nanjingensis]MBB6671553.1 GerAB/ArcD/ProY family transporter [Cohnella nanjingensis]
MRISGTQLFWLISTMQVGMTILLTINPAIMVARQDAWISTLAAGLIGVFIAAVSSRVSLMHPHRTFVEYTRTLLGKWLGNAVVFLYLAFWISVLSIILRQYADLIMSTILPETPILVPIAGMLLVAVYVTGAGLETIARCSELMGPFILLGVAIPVLLVAREARIENIAPVYLDSGWMTVLKGALPPATFLGDCVMLVMLFAFVARPKSGFRPALLGVAVASLLTSATTFTIIAVRGANASASETYSYFNLVRYVSYFDFVQNLDAFVVAIWITGVFVKVSLYFFVTTYGAAQWVGVADWRRMIKLIAPVCLVLALLPRNFLDSSILFPQKIAMPFILPFHMFGMPLVLWGIAKWRGRRAKKMPSG